MFWICLRGCRWGRRMTVVCVSVCVFACLLACLCLYVCVCLLVYVYIYMFVFSYLFVFVYLCLCVRLCLCACPLIRVYVFSSVFLPGAYVHNCVYVCACVHARERLFVNSYVRLLVRVPPWSQRRSGDAICDITSLVAKVVGHVALAQSPPSGPASGRVMFRAVHTGVAVSAREHRRQIGMITCPPRPRCRRRDVSHARVSLTK